MEGESEKKKHVSGIKVGGGGGEEKARGGPERRVVTKLLCDVHFIGGLLEIFVLIAWSR